MVLDPRIDDNAEKIKQLEKAIRILARILDGVAFRVSSDEEKAGIDVLDRIDEILGVSPERGKA